MDAAVVPFRHLKAAYGIILTLTLGVLSNSVEGIRFVDSRSDQFRQRPVRGLWGVDYALETHNHPTHHLHGFLALSCVDAPWWRERESRASTIRTLALFGMAGLVFLPPKEPAGESAEDFAALVNATAETAHQHGLPVMLLSSDPSAQWDLLDAVQADTTQERARREALFSFLSGPGPVDERALQPLLTEVAQLIGAQMTLLDHRGVPVAVTGGPEFEQVLAACGDVVQQVAAGNMDSASLEESGYSLHLIGVGTGDRRSVLAVARDRPFTPGASALVSDTAAALAVRERLASARLAEARMWEVMATARQQVIQLLMNGNVFAAQRAGAAIAPELLGADFAQVFVFDTGTAARRTEALRDCESILGGTALVAGCPSVPHHLNIYAPAEEDTRNAEVRQGLERLLAKNHDYTMGESSPVPIGHLGGAYKQAQRALLLASTSPSRHAVLPRSGEFGYLLDRRSTHWGRSLLAPLRALPYVEAEELMETLENHLSYGRIAVAQLLKRDRRTIKIRYERAEELLGLDFDQLQDRALAELALQVGQHSVDGDYLVPPALEDFLDTDLTREWAKEQLAPISQDEPLREMLIAWIACNAKVEATAETLGVHRNTVYKRLQACEQKLDRDLLSNTAGAHELVFALHLHSDPAVDLRSRMDRLERMSSSRPLQASPTP
ncbi:helix-turn-helix domain-containing protein [Streptomyces acidiscabies]|uniref:Helix-turn-helix domain-containing protein n=1 Tax=Streptomyces acidiscabies TaxID=42234 RepID=A0ABU4LYK4_9ACTN|nr:helix-turn-helix domain-containing protein [Streptomyces acidiscabies]MDX3020084.1 helix-turn-helix domain-containing protein [Streptomyces acidiscabies]